MDTDEWQFLDSWHCDPGELAPDGAAAVFRCAPHAVTAIRSVS